MVRAGNLEPEAVDNDSLDINSLRHIPLAAPNQRNAFVSPLCPNAQPPPVSFVGLRGDPPGPTTFAETISFMHFFSLCQDLGHYSGYWH